MKFEGLLFGVFFGVIVISFGRCQNEPESAPHLYWMLQMALPVREEEGGGGDRTLGSKPVLTCSAGLSSRFIPSHEKPPNSFCWEASSPLGVSRS